MKALYLFHVAFLATLISSCFSVVGQATINESIIGVGGNDAIAKEAGDGIAWAAMNGGEPGNRERHFKVVGNMERGGFTPRQCLENARKYAEEGKCRTALGWIAAPQAHNQSGVDAILRTGVLSLRMLYWALDRDYDRCPCKDTKDHTPFPSDPAPGVQNGGTCPTGWKTWRGACYNPAIAEPCTSYDGHRTCYSIREKPCYTGKLLLDLGCTK